MRKISRIVILLFYTLVFLLIIPQSAWATWDKRCLDPTGQIATIQGFECIFKIILNIATRLAGIAAFIMLLVGGFQYLTSGGDPEKSKSASKTLTLAVAGLVLLVLIWFIFRFVEVFTNVNVTLFQIPGP